MSPCSTPVPFETLVALWAHELPSDEAETIEAHLFACDPCAAESTRLGGLIEGVHQHAPPIISSAHLERMQKRGDRIDVTQVQPGIDAHARYAPELDLLVHALHVQLGTAERVDIEVFSPGGPTILRLDHVPFDRERGLVLVACQRHFEASFPADARFRLLAVEAQAERSLGEYFIHHVWQ